MHERYFRFFYDTDELQIRMYMYGSKYHKPNRKINTSGTLKINDMRKIKVRQYHFPGQTDLV